MKTIRIRPINPQGELRGYVVDEKSTARKVMRADGEVLTPAIGDFVKADDFGPYDVIPAAEFAANWQVVVEKKRGRKSAAERAAMEAADPRQMSIEGHLSNGATTAAPEEKPAAETAEAPVAPTKRKR